MGNTNYQTGARHERQLASAFREEGWYACRSAGSGTAQGPSVDLVCVKDGTFVFVECKSTQDKDNAVDVSKDVQQAIEIAEMAGANTLHETEGVTVKFALSIAVAGETSYRFVPLISNERYTYNDGEWMFVLTMDKDSDYDYTVGGATW